MDNNQPIIVKRVKKVVGGHHGGAWKIAFADFATAMMAFFLVLWLMSSATPEQKRVISGYFQDPIGFSESASPYVIDLGGTPTPSPDKTINPQIQEEPQDEILPDKADEALQAEKLAEQLAEQVDRERLELLLKELQVKVDENPELKDFRDQIHFEITQDGLRIQITDADNRPMFDLGSAQLQPYFEDILLIMADTIKAVPNKISISGHTDAKPFAGRNGVGNWELSASRANAARRTLEAGGYPEDQVARVVGYASSSLFDRDDPMNPVNRRIDIIVLTKKAQSAMEGNGEGAPSDGDSDAPASDAQPAAPGAGDNAAPAPAGAQRDPAAPVTSMPASAVQKQANVFEAGVLKFDQTRQ
ncbi:flagellar motor protein MotB [Pseudomonas matsuisoli]|uniref:Flagellar motor protein MotB n=1 Tax=Pseudomonas matsuisoli TaxID=1515666 RepID=A0A917PXN7_9PSED|nr:flagellar motor protein MotB [Pseudomonas matsuisoli]GGJ97480.1 flagellar motor protein MotB [Pseudomonas matsuisoli]